MAGAARVPACLARGLPEVCERAPFFPHVNVVLGASFWSSQTRASDGEVVVPEVHQVGTATACMLITDPTFPVGGVAPFYIEGTAGDVGFTGIGECTLASNDVPVPGLILAGCNLKIPADPDQGLIGSIATSNSVFNPLGIPGFGTTGSYWTLHIFSRLVGAKPYSWPAFSVCALRARPSCQDSTSSEDQST